MNCNQCNQTEKKCSQKVINQTPLCKKCNLCFICRQKNNIKLNIDLHCSLCCDVCKECHKILLKNNWPNDNIVNNLCNKCTHLCVICKKYAIDNKCIYKRGKRYCNNCFINKYDPSGENEKFALETRLDSSVRIFVKWEKDKIRFMCTLCNKKSWKSVKNKTTKCNKCKTKARTILHHTPNPSSDKAKYTLITDADSKCKKLKWVLDEKQEYCSQCCMSIWIKKDNMRDGKYSCSRCKPSLTNYKYKYNKSTQLWAYYSQKIRCMTCLKQKWMHINNKNFGKKICGSCIKLKI